MHGRLLRYEFVGRDVCKVSLFPELREQQKYLRLVRVPVGLPFLLFHHLCSPLLHLPRPDLYRRESENIGLAKKFTRVFPLEDTEKPQETFWPTQQNKMISWGLLSTGTDGNHRTHTVCGPLRLNQSPSQHTSPLKTQLENLSDISQLPVTLFTDHHLYFKHLLLSPKVLKTEFLGTQSTSHDAQLQIGTLTAFLKR